MPSIPLYTQQYQRQGLPDVRADGSAGRIASAGSDAAAGALAQLGGVMSAEAKQMKAREDNLAAKTAYREASEALSSFLRDPENGVYTRRGTGAKGASKDFDIKAAEISGKITANLSAVQKDMFQNAWMSTVQSEKDALSRFEMSEFQKVEDAADASILQLSAREAANSYNNPDITKGHYNKAVMTLVSQSDRQGWTSDIYQAKLKEFENAYYGGIIERGLQEKDLSEAEKAFNEHREHLDPALAGRLKSRLDAMGAAKRGEDAAEAVWAKTMGAGMDFDEPVRIYEMYDALSKDKKLTADEQTYSAARNALSAKASAWNAQQAEIKQGGELAVWDMLSRGSKLPELKATKAWQDMDGAGRVRIEQFYQAADDAEARRHEAGAQTAQQILSAEKAEDALKQRANFKLFNAYSDREKLLSTPIEELEGLIPALGITAVQALIESKRGYEDPASVLGKEKAAEELNFRANAALYNELQDPALLKIRSMDALKQYEKIFSPQRMESIYAKKREIDNGQGMEVATKDDMLKRSAMRSGIIPYAGETKPTPEQQEVYAKFTDDVQTRVRIWEKANPGKTAGFEQVQKVIDESLMDKVFIEKSYFFSSDPEDFLFNVPSENRTKVYLRMGNENIRQADIPEKDRLAIEQALINNNRPLTLRNIINVWNSKRRPTK